MTLCHAKSPSLFAISDTQAMYTCKVFFLHHKNRAWLWSWQSRPQGK